MTRIYKLLGRADWAAAVAKGRFTGAGVDLADGYIHFSTGPQAPMTARLHFSGREDLVLVEIEADDLGGGLKWEPSRGGDLFPHLYGALDVSLARSVRPLTVDETGVPILGDLA